MKYNPDWHRIRVPETASLIVYDLDGGSPTNGRALYDDGRTEVEVDASLYLEAVLRGTPRGQALALALGQRPGTVVNGAVATLDAILNGIRARRAN